MRGDVFEKWRQRVQLAEAGLSEEAANQLRHMQSQIIRLLGKEAQFDPDRAVADPGDLLAGVLRFKRLIETRDRLQNRFQLLLQLGPVLFGALLLLAAGIVLMFIHYGGIASNPLLSLVGVAISAASGAIVVICFGFYVYLQQSLSGAEILSASENLNA